MERARWLILFVVFNLLVCPQIAVAEFPVTITGVDGDTQKNILLHLGTFSDKPAENSKALRKRISNAVTKGANALGLYELQFKHSVEDNAVQIEISDYRAVTWDQIDIRFSGTPSAKIRQLINDAPFKAGARINHSSYDSFKRNLHHSALREGFLDAVYTLSQLQIDLDDYRADLSLHLESGERYAVKQLTFSGSSIDQDVLQELSPIEEGDWHSALVLSDLNKVLLDSGYFESIDVDTQKDQDNHTTRIAVQLTDSANHRFTTGIGFGTDTGPRLKLGWNMPHVGKRGHSFFSETQVSSISRQISTQYKIPFPHPLKRYLSWDTGYKEERLEDTESDILNTGLDLNIVTRNNWRITYGVDLEYEKYRQGKQATEEVTYLIPNAAWSRTQFEGQPMDPDGGYKHWLHVDTSSTGLGSDTNFIRVRTGARWLYEFYPDHRLLARFEVGAIKTESFNRLPSSKRFFTGGDQSIRGYGYKKVAPVDEDGELTGGQYLNTGSLEYGWRFLPNWQGAVFMDAGRAYNDQGARFLRSAGIGLRWITPIGPVSLDIAVPINDPDEDQPRFHIYMGPVL